MADEDNKLNVKQAQIPSTFVNAKGMEMPLNFRQLDRNGRLNIYQKMIKDGKKLNDEQQKDYDNIKNEGKSVDFARNDKDLERKKQTEDDEKRKFFEEKDILEYLYQNWLLDGANWICDKLTKKIEWATKSTATWLWDTGKDAKRGMKDAYKEGKEGKKPNNAMTGYAAAMDGTSEQHRVQNCNIANTAMDKFDEKMDRFSHTFDVDPNTHITPTEEDLNDPTYQVLYHYARSYGPARAQALCRKCSEEKHEEIKNLLAINYVAVALTRAQHVQQNLELETPETAITPEQFAAETKRNMYLIARKLNASRNPETALEDMVKKVDKANKTVNESLDKGKYLSNEDKKWRKSPITNKALKHLNKLLDIDENNQISAQVQQDIEAVKQTELGQLIDHADKSQTMVERLVGEQTQQQGFAARQAALDSAEAANSEDKKEWGKDEKRFYEKLEARGLADTLRKRGIELNEKFPTPLRTNSNQEWHAPLRYEGR